MFVRRGYRRVEYDITGQDGKKKKYTESYK